MTSDLCSDDVVVCIASPQVISSSVGLGGGRVAASSAAVELGRRLLLAARAGLTAQVLDLMAKGAPFTTDWLGTSPLHLAASNNHVETCAVLLRAGVSRDSRTKVERTPLHLAAYAGHADVVRLLLQHDAALDCRDMLRMTPLHWAAARGQEGAARALLAAGCQRAPLSKFGKTPRQLALAAGHHRVAQLIDQADDDGAPPRPELTPMRSVSMSSAETMPTAPTSPATPATPAAPWRAQQPAKDADADPAPDDTDAPRGFHPIHRLQEIKATNIKVKQQQDKTSTNEPKTETNNSSSNSNGSDTRAAQLLRRHGITLLPADDGSTVLSALQSGRTVVLSDAGKLMLKESSPPQAAGTGAEGASPSKGLKVFTLNNKLLLHNNKPLGKNITNVQLSQVKFVQLKDKLSAPQKAVPLRPGARRQPTPVRIVVNKNNVKLLAPPADAQTSVSLPPAGEAGADDDNAALRSQLQAARKAIAALTAELASCKARLAQLEQR